MGDFDPNIADRFSELRVGNSSNESLFQVMKAVEDAENTIRLQLEENNHLKDELLQKTQELEKYKLDIDKYLRISSDGPSDWKNEGSYMMQTSASPVGIIDKKIRLAENSYLEGGHQYSDRREANGALKVSHIEQSNADAPATSQTSPSSSRSLSPRRHRKEGVYETMINSSGQELLQMFDTNSNQLKQDLLFKIKEHEDEILQLRRHLADYSVKEAQIRNEKYVLEKRIAHMRMAFDEQQKELVDAASKALSYRQDIIEENIRLTYALQAAQQERSTYVSSLLPLLAEYGLQPPSPDAFSIVSNLKVLFKHLHEKYIITEEKLKESQYQLAPWRIEASNVVPQSPPHSLGTAFISQTNDLEKMPKLQSTSGLEIVPQPSYSLAHSPIASPSDAQKRADWEALGYQTLQSGSSNVAIKNPNHGNIGGSSSFINRNTLAEDIPAQVALTQDDSQGTLSAEPEEKVPSPKDLSGGNDMDESEALGSQNARESALQWGPASSPNIPPGLDDHNAYPYLPPVLEEPGSSFSEAAEDDPLPAIEGLQISGEAFPGRELQACGYSINGTTSCNFEWVRYLEDGSVNYIDGAKQPVYLVTADDVDSYLAIEVQPLDNRKRKGELVNVLANEQKKITCDPQMQEQIERTLSTGHVSYEVSISTGVLNFWEHAILIIKREGYSIRSSGSRGVVEKFSPSTEIRVLYGPYGQATEFSIQGTSEVEHLLRTASSFLRDTIVLTMRLFKMRAIEKRKGKRKGLFFK